MPVYGTGGVRWRTVMSESKILMVDDDHDVLVATRLFLKQHGYQVDTEEQPVYLPQLLKNKQYDLILLDMNFSKGANRGKEGFYWLDQVLDADPAAVVIMVTAYGDVELAIQAIKRGATDFVQKPWKAEKLLATLSAALKLSHSRREVSRLQAFQNEQLNDQSSEIIGVSQPMQKLFEQIQKVAKTDANVLLLGENGTGKELVARALHRQSLRHAKSFVGIDMGAVHESLFESELFGHAKGAFTGAHENRIGRFELADKGTLFLDEIGNLSLSLQAKLLTALQNRVIVRLGENRPVSVDIRLISATNMDIHEMVKEKDFRQDLLYRINTVEIFLPPLRDRNEDIELLANHFLQKFATKYKKQVKAISQAAVRRMEKYSWPGNVRELEHAIERAVIMADGNILQPADFYFSPASVTHDSLEMDTYHLEEVEKLVIRKVISKHGGNISLAAKELGLTRTSLYRRIEKYGL